VRGILKVVQGNLRTVNKQIRTPHVSFFDRKEHAPKDGADHHDRDDQSDEREKPKGNLHLKVQVILNAGALNSEPPGLVNTNRQNERNRALCDRLVNHLTPF
jgi:hypothetical protein